METEEVEATITIEVVDMQIQKGPVTTIKKEETAVAAEVATNHVVVTTIEVIEEIAEIVEVVIKIIAISTIKIKIIKMTKVTISNLTQTLRNSIKKTKETSKFSKETAEVVAAIKNMIIMQVTEAMINNSNTIPDQGEAMQTNIKTATIKILMVVPTHSTGTLNKVSIMNTRVISRKIRPSLPIIVITTRIIRNKLDN